jgi:predicted HNH restriction endonuclease
VKQSRAKGKEQKVEVHHADEINWDGLCDLIRERLLQTPDRLVPLCPECHKKEHSDARKVLP